MCLRELVADKNCRHTLSNDEKLAYINAELCLMKLPAKTDLKGAVSRFDDFQALHVHAAYMSHFVVCSHHATTG